MMKKIIVPVLFFTVFFGSIYYFTPSSDEVSCNAQMEFRRLEIYGVVKKKYIDKYQHSYPMVEVFQNKSKGSCEINLSFESGVLFDRIGIFDTLCKEKNADTLLLKKANGGRETLKADLGCITKQKNRSHRL